MAGPREPIDLVIAKNRKHLTKKEIAARREQEVAPCADDLTPPGYLTAAQKKHFNKLAQQLDKIKIMGETDADTLARYVVAETEFQATVKDLRKLEKDRPADREDPDYYKKLERWMAMQEIAERRQERYFKQASALARDLGLTISSRCKLAVPQVPEEKPKGGKFAQFTGRAAGDR